MPFPRQTKIHLAVNFIILRTQITIDMWNKVDNITTNNNINERASELAKVRDTEKEKRDKEEKIKCDNLLSLPIEWIDLCVTCTVTFQLHSPINPHLPADCQCENSFLSPPMENLFNLETENRFLDVEVHAGDHSIENFN